MFALVLIWGFKKNFVIVLDFETFPPKFKISFIGKNEMEICFPVLFAHQGQGMDVCILCMHL